MDSDKKKKEEEKKAQEAEKTKKTEKERLLAGCGSVLQGMAGKNVAVELRGDNYVIDSFTSRTKSTCRQRSNDVLEETEQSREIDVPIRNNSILGRSLLISDLYCLLSFLYI
ncbi:hypothetical protein B9Z55_001433 [Caenorhabditis nigoni]|uniref:Uncharacterized protein n=1 Tax=Caenorhabditis nigoni TaxID=1611254 RepID=A0A2G5VFY3_9PELO|nr:hypothetical protein B9Z55_001433 [Caenorhabditis nigoni]